MLGSRREEGVSDDSLVPEMGDLCAGGGEDGLVPTPTMDEGGDGVGEESVRDGVRKGEVEISLVVDVGVGRGEEGSVLIPWLEVEVSDEGGQGVREEILRDGVWANSGVLDIVDVLAGLSVLRIDLNILNMRMKNCREVEK